MAILLCIFLVIVAVDIWTVILLIFGCNARRWLVVSYFAAVLLTLMAAFQMTFTFSYYHNANTRFVGWPIPSVVFQRDTPTSSWQDFVGPTTMWAWPVNFIFFMLIPSVVTLIFIFLLRRKDRRQQH